MDFPCKIELKQTFIRKLGMSIDSLLNIFFRKTPDRSRIKKVLVLRQDRIGDQIVTTPLYRAIKHNLPGVTLHVMASDASAEVIKYNPHIDKIIPFNLSWFDYKISTDPKRRVLQFMLILFSREFRELIRSVRDERYDLIIDAVGRRRNALLAYLARVPCRIGFDFPFGSFLFSHRQIMDYNVHYSVNLLSLLKSLGIEDENTRPEIFTPPYQAGTDRYKFLEKEPSQINILLHIGYGNSPERKWSASHWSALIDLLQADEHYRVFVVFSPPEEAFWKEIQEEKPNRKNLCSIISESIYTFATIVSYMDIFVGIDSGSSHFASALNIPLVVLYSAQTPVWWGPLSDNAIVLRKIAGNKCINRNCRGAKCMNAIEPFEVKEAVDSLALRLQSFR